VRDPAGWLDHLNSVGVDVIDGQGHGALAVQDSHEVTSGAGDLSVRSTSSTDPLYDLKQSTAHGCGLCRFGEGPVVDGSGTEVSAHTLYGHELRRLRRSSGKTVQQVADAGSCTPSLVYMLETANRRPHAEFTTPVDELLEAGGLLVRIQAVIDKEQKRYLGWFKGYVNAEERAIRLRGFDAQVIPGLMQAPSYARRLFEVRRPRVRDAQPIEDQVAARMMRRAILYRGSPPEVWFTISEAALRTAAALSRECAVEQYELLLEMAALPHVVIEVLPDRVGLHACMSGSFTLITSPKGRECAYVETMGKGWLMEDDAEVREAEFRYNLMRTVALSPEESVAFVRTLLMECQQ